MKRWRILFQGGDADKRDALTILHDLGATAAVEKLTSDMRALGIKAILRGNRKNTKDNPAMLTDRELEIVKLLQPGLVNKEIAGRLFISGIA